MVRKSGNKERITEELRQYILEAQSDALVKLPSERTWMDKYQVNAKTLQAILMDLLGEEVLISVNGKGIFIPPKNVFQTLHIMYSSSIKKNDPFYLKFLQVLTGTAAKFSINLVFLDKEQIKQTTEIPLIIIGLIEDKLLLDQLVSSYKRIIAIENYSSYNNRISQIYFNDYRIGWQAANLLVNFNHKKVLLLTGSEKHTCAMYRKNGFLDAMKEHGIQARVHTEAMNMNGGYQAGEFLLNEFKGENRPTAVFAANDWMAIGLMKKLKESGLDIPKDISVLGCGDIPLSEEFEPKLTSFAMDMKYLIMELFSLINKLSVTKEDMTQKVLLPAELIVRETLRKL